ncbi:hypothetical protein DOS62_06685 [Staphylococcus felis]|uniref:hypothetical protein n=1 Tax=Staphylococcus felis TaxID=46127 RepID=UPI000E2847AB|nr:hypothetical protein [Staphylococcus felis]REI04071.1 hypothetical protein DOS62_06685 [Staphylococcus felis]
MSELEIYDMQVIDRMTLYEYYMRLWALERTRLREEYERYKLAFAIRNAKATENVGTKKDPKEKYVFESPEDIIDYAENLKRISRNEPLVFRYQGKDIQSNDKELLNLISDINNQIK